MKFIPFSEAREAGRESVVAVDCFLPGALNLSHWRGAAPPAKAVADTSAGIVLNALKKGLVPPGAKWVTNNHFDIDGFIGIWAMLNPELALRHERLLKAIAVLGDFRELPEDEALASKTISLVAWINSVERQKFYAPFEKKQKEEEACVDKYRFFLKAFETVLDNPGLFYQDWQEEHDRVVNDLAKQEKEANTILVSDIRLQRIFAPEPIHYYALFGSSSTADMVLTMYPGNWYELEYKYTTWVDAHGRKSFPRLQFTTLIQQLNDLESSGLEWSGADVTDTGPILRLGPSILDKEIRFDHPFNRPFYSSSIGPATFEKTIINFYRNAYIGIEPREIWTWEEIRKLNQQISFKNKNSRIDQ